jgi:hypothetical protein
VKKTVINRALHKPMSHGTILLFFYYFMWLNWFELVIFYWMNCLCFISSQGILDTTLCDKVCQWLAAGQWFSPGTPVSSFNKTDCHNVLSFRLNIEHSCKHVTCCFPNWWFWNSAYDEGCIFFTLKNKTKIKSQKHNASEY